jgi:hypothetical protein
MGTVMVRSLKWMKTANAATKHATTTPRRTHLLLIDRFHTVRLTFRLSLAVPEQDQSQAYFAHGTATIDVVVVNQCQAWAERQ